MELGIRERIMLLGILPQEGKVITLKIVKQLRDDLGFSEDEIKDNEMVEADGSVKWLENGYLKEVPVGEKATDVIADAFKKLDGDGKMQIQFLDVYDKFVKS
uniref:Uncharacterized protein n=1 Tax=viral metagenome TaxID=1070528 RepID=A0A6M3K8Y7_9ZZZZ